MFAATKYVHQSNGEAEEVGVERTGPWLLTFLLETWKGVKAWEEWKHGTATEDMYSALVNLRDERWLTEQMADGQSKDTSAPSHCALGGLVLCFRGGCGMVVQNTPKWSVTFSLHLLGCINTVASLSLLLVSEGPQFLLSILESAYGKVLHTLGVSFPPMVPLGDASFFANPVCFGWEWFSCTVESESKGWKDSRHRFYPWAQK